MNSSWKKHLPTKYAATLKEFGYPNNLQSLTAGQLITLWRAAIAAYKEAPTNSNDIAAETMSAGAYSPLVDEDNDFSEIHFAFGELEIPARISDAHAWKQLEQDIEALAARHGL